MNMAVNHDGGPVPVQQRAKAFKSLMRMGVLVTDTADGRVGQKNIKSASGTQLSPERRNPGGHLRLGIHMHRVGAVPYAAAEAEDPHPVDSDDPILDTFTAFRRLL